MKNLFLFAQNKKNMKQQLPAFKDQLIILMTLLTCFSFTKQSVAQDIVITEINYNPPESGTDTTEYIEFYNNGSTAVNLQGYTLVGATFTFPSVMLNPGEFILASVDSVAILNRYGANSFQFTSGGLSNGGENIVLKNNLGVTVDSLRYDDIMPWPTGTDGDGASLVLCDPNSDNTDGNNWKASTSSTGVTINGNEVFGSPLQVDAACSEPDCNLLIEVNKTDISCNGENDGSVTVSASAGVEPYFYAWSNGEIGDQLTQLNAGTYQVTIVDSVGCTDSNVVITITEPSELVASVTTTNETSAGANDGSALVTTTGGTGPYTYLWSNAAVTDSILNLSPATYSVTITDANGCTTIDEGTVTGTLVGIEINNIESKVNIYPNPSNGEFQVSTSGLYTQLSIFNILGKEVYSANNLNNETINVSAQNLTPGSYFLTLTGNNNKVVKTITIK